jgi:hypothetical protein
MMQVAALDLSLRAEERQLIETIARLDGVTVEQFTPQQINLILEQARHIGDLPERSEPA